MSKPRLILSFVAVILAACMVLAASATAQSITMKIGHATTKGAYDNWADTFKAGLAERVGDRIKVEVYPLSQLGAIPAMVQGVQLGTIEMVMTPPAFLSGVDPRFGVLSAPGIFEDLMHGFRTVHDPAFKKAYWSIGDAKGRHVVRFYLVAMLFVVFDVELVFLYPWAVHYAEQGVFSDRLFLFGEMLVFVAILLVAYAYAFKKGVFEWNRGD